MKKIFVITPWIPYPLNSGGNQGTFNTLSVLSKHFDVTVCILADSHGDDFKMLTQQLPQVNFIQLPISDKSHYGLFRRIYHRLSKDIFKDNYVFKIDQMYSKFGLITSYIVYQISDYLKNHNFDLIQVEYYEALPIVYALPKDVKKLFVHHEIGYVVNELKSDFSDKYCYFKFLEAKDQEIAFLNRYDGVVTVSKVDATKLSKEGVTTKIYPSFSSIKLENNIKEVKPYRKYLSFVGPEVHTPNKVGLLWFLNNCWSAILEKDAELKLQIIGKWTDETEKKFISQYSNIEFKGFVEDLPTCLSGSIMIVPITVGSGIRMKLLESTSNHIPFVSTTVGAEGLPFNDNEDGFIKSSAKEFIDSALALQDIEKQRKFAKSAYDKVIANYSIDALEQNKIAIINDILKNNNNDY